MKHRRAATILVAAAALGVLGTSAGCLVHQGGTDAYFTDSTSMGVQIRTAKRFPSSSGERSNGNARSDSSGDSGGNGDCGGNHCPPGSNASPTVGSPPEPTAEATSNGPVGNQRTGR